jgi:hypothetical protein
MAANERSFFKLMPRWDKHFHMFREDTENVKTVE